MRSNLFTNEEARYKNIREEQLIALVHQHTQELLAGMHALPDDTKVAVLILGAQLGVAGDGKLDLTEKKLIDAVFSRFVRDGMDTICELICREITEEAYNMLQVFIKLGNQIAIPLLRYILCFAYADGVFEDAVAKKLDGMFGMSLLVEFAASGETDVPAPQTKLSGLEAEMARWFHQNDTLHAVNDIYVRFPRYSRSEIHTALNALCEMGILYGGEHLMNMYGLVDHTDTNKSSVVEDEEETAAEDREQEWKEMPEQDRDANDEECDEAFEEEVQENDQPAPVCRQKEKQNKNIWPPMVGVIAAVVLCSLLVTKVIMPNAKYKDAEAYLAAGQYEDAIAVFTELGNYQDAAERAVEAKNEKTYVAAEAMLADKDFSASMETFASLGSYRDAANRVTDVQTAFEMWKEEQYAAAETMIANGDYDNASDVFAKLGDYQDSDDMVRYAKAAKLLAHGSYDDAVEAFMELGSFRDAETRVLECWYEKGKVFREQNLYYEAAMCWTTSYDFADSHDLLMECCYTWALERLEAEDFETAYVLLEDCVKYGDYLDAAEILRESRFSRAEAFAEKGQFAAAAELYRAASEEQQANYYEGKSAYVAGKYYAARDLLTLAGDYEDAAELVAECTAIIQDIEEICGIYRWSSGVFNGKAYGKDDYAASSDCYQDRIISYNDEDGLVISIQRSYGTSEEYSGRKYMPDGKYIYSTRNGITSFYQIEGDTLLDHGSDSSQTWYKKVQ